MNQTELIELLSQLSALPKETEWFEFKEAQNNFHFNDLGKYFSALSNEANLKNQPYGWLIFGVSDNRTICGSNYRSERSSLDSLKFEIAQQTNNRITFVEIYELSLPEGRVIMFQIPPALRGQPTSWQGHFYGRDGESLVPLNLHELEFIRKQSSQSDWSAEICYAASLNDLDQLAIDKARQEFIVKNPKLSKEIKNWDNTTFLNKSKLTINGNITNAAIILLGRPESTIHLKTGTGRITWLLKDDNNIEKDYEHFDPPLLINTDQLLNKIRNLKYRFLPDKTLFPIEINMYDTYVIREALHNSIAHQDYLLNSRITVVENPNDLLFTNAGSFLPGSVENVIAQDSPPSFYRNRLLADAMVNLNMIDTIGSGIKRMYLTQKDRYFPLPEFDLTSAQVSVKIYGRIIDEKYTKLLIAKIDLDLQSVILLDRLQKNLPISKKDANSLRKRNLIEGRFPNIYISSEISIVGGSKSSYIKNLAFDKKYYKDLVINFIKQYKEATRDEIDDLLLNKISDVLTFDQKRRKVKNLLYEMSRKDHSIKNVGTNKYPKWQINS